MALNLEMKLTKAGNFLLREALKSENAVRAGIANIPNDQELKNIVWAAEKMEILRAFGGGGVIDVSSWFRCLPVNELAGSKPTSAHVKGFAVDHNRLGLSPRQWWNKLTPKVKEFGIDQLILEYDNWVHVGFKGPGIAPRHEVFTIGC